MTTKLGQSLESFLIECKKQYQLAGHLDISSDDIKPGSTWQAIRQIRDGLNVAFSQDSDGKIGVACTIFWNGTPFCFGPQSASDAMMKFVSAR